MQYTTYLRWGILAGLFALLLVPFIIANSFFFPFITGKNFFFRIVVEFVTLLYIILALKEPQYRPKASMLLWSALAFTVWMGVATIFSVDPIKSFWSNFERMEGYITVLHLFAVFVVMGAVLPVQNMWKRFFQTSVVAGTLMALYAFAQVLHLFGFAPSSQSGARADGYFGNATYLAVYMLFNIFITLFLLIRDRRSTTMQSLYGVALVLQLAALYFTETRGSILGLLGGLFIGALYITIRGQGKEWQWFRRASWVTIGVIVLLIGSFVALRNSSVVRNSSALGRLASISLQDATTESRFLIWHVAYEGFRERPVTGWGQENFNFVFNKYYPPQMYNQEQWFDRAHNQFIDWLIAGGLPAFLLYISLFGFALWAIVRSQLSVPEQAVFMGLLAGYAFNNMFVFDNIGSSLYFFAILAFLHGMSWRTLPRFMFLSKPMSDRALSVAAPIAVILMFGSFWFFNVAGLARAQTLIKALTTSTSPQDSLAAFKTALSQGELGKQETVEQIFQLASSVAASTVPTPDVKQQVYSATHDAGEALLSERPGDARLEMFMGLFLLQYGQTEEALTHLTRASQYSPAKQQILFSLGQAYLTKGDTQNALSIFKKAFDEAPDYDLARITYAGALYVAGQTAQGDALLTEKFGTTLVDNDQVIQVYTNVKFYDRVIAILSARVSKNPQDATLHLNLASAYFAAGKINETIAELQKYAQLDPSKAGEIQTLISQIKAGTVKPQ
jgi:O-antigen ligase/tetratricopeptide (TPR) repeat protein